MANVFNRHTLEDGWRNAVVTVTGLLDTSDANFDPVVELTDLLNNDTRAGTLRGLRVDRIQYSMSAGTGLEVQLYWKHSVGNNQLITAIAGQGHDKYQKAGGLIPKMDALGYQGGIVLSTTGFSKNPGPTGFTVTLHLVKLYR
jgi:hypothetical protein